MTTQTTFDVLSRHAAPWAGPRTRKCWPRTRRWATVGLALAAICGCTDSTPENAPPAASLSALEVLEKLVAAYRTAESYQDSGQVSLNYVQGSSPATDTADFSVAWRKPDQLRLHVYQAMVVCDGRQVLASLADLPGQVLQTTAPGELTLESLLAADSVLANVLTTGIAGPPPQLAFLLEDDPLQSLLEGVTPELLADESLEGSACYRIRVDGPDGELVFWVDQQSFVLRRLEYPVRTLAEQMSKSGPVTGVSLVADFRGAALDGEIDPVAFEFAVPAEARVVAALDASGAPGAGPPPPEPPSPLLGQPTPDFEFTALDGQRLTREALTGQIAVLLFWSQTSEPSVRNLVGASEAWAQQQQAPGVQFWAVNIDPNDVPAAELSAVLQQAGASLPIARDEALSALNVFDVQKIPTLFILGADGTVQDHEVGVNPALAEELPRRIQELLSGGSLVDDARTRYATARRAYERALSEAANSGSTLTEIPHAALAPRSEPATLQMTRRWSYREVQHAGNLLIYTADDGTPRICVLDEFRQVLELNSAGELIATHELDIPPDAVVAVLRTAVDGAGRRYFAGTASTQQQVFVFDESWQTVLAFPASGQHAGIADVQLADLDHDGQLDLVVGYLGVVGVQRVSLDGQRQWGNRSLDNVLRLSISNPASDGSRMVLATHVAGTIAAISASGQDLPPLALGQRFVRWLTSTDSGGDGVLRFCAVAATQVGQEEVVGLSADGHEEWSYKLPEGVQANPALEMIVAGALLPDEGALWIAAGPDSSLHLLSQDGALVDQFNYGAALLGLGVAGDLLVVATDSGIDAWELRRP